MKHREVWLLIVFTLVVRGGVLWTGFDDLRADPDSYRQLANNLIEYGTFGFGERPTAFRPPLYPLMLVPLAAATGAAPVGVALLHLALGCTTVWLTWLIGTRWGLGRWATVAAVLVAIDPILLRQSTLVMTETVATCATTLALLLLTTTSNRAPISSARLMAGGAVIGLAVLIRPTFLVWGAFGMAAMLSPFRRDEETLRLGFMPRLRQALLVSVGLLLVLLPWVARNRVSMGRPIIATTHGGFTLLLANNPAFYTYLREAPSGTVWDATSFNTEHALQVPRRSPSEEIDSNRLDYQLAWQHIRSEPRMFVYSCFVRLARFWGVLPHRVGETESQLRSLSRYAIATWYAIIFLLAIVGAVTWRREMIRIPWAWATMLVVSLSLVHVCYWSNLRMRAPLVPVISFCAAAGAARLRGQYLCCKSRTEHELRV